MRGEPGHGRGSLDGDPGRAQEWQQVGAGSLAVPQVSKEPPCDPVVLLLWEYSEK